MAVEVALDLPDYVGLRLGGLDRVGQLEELGLKHAEVAGKLHAAAKLAVEVIEGQHGQRGGAPLLEHRAHLDVEL